MRKRVVIAAMSVLSAALLASSAFAAEEIKIGALFPLTGPAAVSGQNCINSVLAAADFINEANPEINAPLAAGEGLLGGKYVIKIVQADHQGKPDVAKSEAERLWR